MSLEPSSYRLHESDRAVRLIVVSNTRVHTRDDRTFSARDGATLFMNFKKRLGVDRKDYVPLGDLSKDELVTALKKEAENKDLEHYGMLIVVLMSYGYTGHIYDTNNEPVNVDELMELFRGSHCFALVGKPKLFIVQACEGDLYQPESVVQCDADSTPSQPKCYIPSEADMLILWSPVPGRVRWRDSLKETSPFVSALEWALQTFPEMEISRLMTRVTQKVCEELEENAGQEFRDGGRVLPYMIHMLTKELYFHTITASINK